MKILKFWWTPGFGSKAARTLRHRSTLVRVLPGSSETFDVGVNVQGRALGHPSVVLQDPVDAVAGDTQDGLGGAAQVPDAAVPGLSLQPLGGGVAGQAVQATGAAVVGLVQAGQAPVGQALIQGPETGGRVSGSEEEEEVSGWTFRTSVKHGKPGDPPAVPGAMQAAVVTARFRSGAAHGAGPAGASAGRLVQHGQMGGGGVGGRALGGRPPGLPRDRRVGVPEQQLGEVGLPEDLAALVHHGAAARGGGVNAMLQPTLPVSWSRREDAL